MKQQLYHPVRLEPEVALARAEAHIAWVLGHPDMSPWLKAALRSAAGHDPIAIRNDVEMLRHLIAQRADAEVEISINRATAG